MTTIAAGFYPNTRGTVPYWLRPKMDDLKRGEKEKACRMEGVVNG